MNPTQNADLIEVTPAVTLRGAGLYLVRHGWHQGDMFADPEVPLPAACGLGAIRMAVFGTPSIEAESLVPATVNVFDTAVAVLADHLILRHAVIDPSEPGNCPFLDREDLEGVVLHWNDDPSRIASHVIAAMYNAADEWDRTHRPHADYPHEPGTLYDCPACEADCFCTDGFTCVHCAIRAESGGAR